MLLLISAVAHHEPGSANANLLSKWLGDVNLDSQMGTKTMSDGDWMLLTLSSMGGQASQLGRAYVESLLQKGDVQTAATILLGIGDHRDAVEAFVSHNLYM